MLRLPPSKLSLTTQDLTDFEQFLNDNGKGILLARTSNNNNNNNSSSNLSLLGGSNNNSNNINNNISSTLSNLLFQTQTSIINVNNPIQSGESQSESSFLQPETIGNTTSQHQEQVDVGVLANSMELDTDSLNLHHQNNITKNTQSYFDSVHETLIDSQSKSGQIQKLELNNLVESRFGSGGDIVFEGGGGVRTRRSGRLGGSSSVRLSDSVDSSGSSGIGMSRHGAAYLRGAEVIDAQRELRRDMSRAQRLGIGDDIGGNGHKRI